MVRYPLFTVQKGTNSRTQKKLKSLSPDSSPRLQLCHNCFCCRSGALNHARELTALSQTSTGFQGSLGGKEGEGKDKKGWERRVQGTRRYGKNEKGMGSGDRKSCAPLSQIPGSTRPELCLVQFNILESPHQVLSAALWLLSRDWLPAPQDTGSEASCVLCTLVHSAGFSPASTCCQILSVYDPGDV